MYVLTRRKGEGLRIDELEIKVAEIRPGEEVDLVTNDSDVFITLTEGQSVRIDGVILLEVRKIGQKRIVLGVEAPTTRQITRLDLPSVEKQPAADSPDTGRRNAG